jgi:hypothetical protein
LEKSVPIGWPRRSMSPSDAATHTTIAMAQRTSKMML